MLRRLRGGKRSATRNGYNDVNDQGSDQDEVYIDAAHKQLGNHRPSPASPSRRSSHPQKKVSSPPSKNSRQEHYRNRLDRLGRDHQSQQRRHEAQSNFDSPDDVSRGFTSLTYESSITGASNTSKSRNVDNSVSFSTIWEREESDFEPYASNTDSTPLRIAEARRSALNIARNDRNMNTYKPDPVKHRSNVNNTSLQTPMNQSQESRRSKGHDIRIKSRLPSEMKRKDDSPPPSFIASSAQTQKLDNGTNHLITRLLKKHKYQAERSKEKDETQTVEVPEQAELAPSTTTARNRQTTSVRKVAGQKPDPVSKSTSAAAARLDRPPDPPAEEWKRPIPVKHVASTYTKHTASSSKFWDEVENFPTDKVDRELQQFFRQNLVRVKKQAVELERSRKEDPRTKALVSQQRRDTPQDDTDNFSNAFSLNLAVDKQGHFDDSDISALEMFDSATVYHQNALAAASGDAKNYWKLKYDRLKEETRDALKQNKIVEEPSWIEEKDMDQTHEPKPYNELNRLFSGLTVDLDDGAASPFCRDELAQTMNMLMKKAHEIENSGTMQFNRRLEDAACAEMAEQVIFPVETPQSEQNNLKKKRSLADDLTANGSRIDENERHIVEFEPAEAQRFSPICTISEREATSMPDQKHHGKSKPSDGMQGEKINIITPDKSAETPRHKPLHPDTDVTHPMLCLGSLHTEATSSERVKQSLLRCSDSLMSRFLSSSNSNQLAIPYGIDPQKLIRSCQNPQVIGKTLSQTLVHYGKKVMQKREVVSELNHNIVRFGARHPLVGESHLKVGILHMYDGHYADSILHLEEALKIKTCLEPDHQDLSSILMFIALDQLALERFDDCMASLVGVRRFREDAVGCTHPEIGLILNNIACLHYELGDSIRAEKLFQQALDLQREAFTTEPTFLESVSTLLSNIAFLHAKNGLFSKALIELEGALQIQQEILCDEGNESEAILENMAHIMAIQKMQHGSGNMEEITNQYMTMLKRR